MNSRASEEDRKSAERRLSGRDMKKIREKCGYSAREFADFLHRTGAPIATERSVYRLEERRKIPFRYVDALTRFVGTKYFDLALAEVVEEERKQEEWRQELARRRQAEEEERERRRRERLARKGIPAT